MLEGMEPSSKKRSCKAKFILNGLEKKDAEILETAYANIAFVPEDLSEQLSKRGVSIGPHSIRRHRDKKCTCYRI